MSLDDFILKWNRSHKYLVFGVQNIPALNRPTSIDIRYPAAKYGRLFLNAENWQSLKTTVALKSHATMHVTTDPELFERGIIEIKISSQDHNYQERLVIGTLKWIGEVFFPQ